ncbi:MULTISPECIES: hypothetical protein [Bacillaceae]|uniref:hypothetical protein n=1 Tax=Bacillaceae TaxID=186817 RepID=UPI001269CAB0|nr:hypothetical protein [Caldibacillus thermoamylovorans]
MVTRPLLVVIFMRETPFFGDETFSRRHFEPKNAYFWRRDHFSSSLLREKLHFLVTRLFLVVILSREMPLFGDETLSRRHFLAGNSIFWRRNHFSSSLLGGNATFWRRDSFSSSFLYGKLHFLATRPLLVVTFAREIPFFGDETTSRRHFEPGNATFWRRDHFSSSLLREKLHFLATKPFLVVIFARKTPLFGDETLSRRHFCTKNSTFWR